MIRLTDSELDAVFNAARPLAVEARDAFLQEVALALQNCAEIGPGTVHRVCAAAQAHFFDPPLLVNGTWGHSGRERSRLPGKWGR